jgi:multicomponent Na+:H+ antiporter subunit B
MLLLKNSPIIKPIVSFIIPYITLYAIYIQLNGENSPGGGFQAGVIFASAMVGYTMLFGSNQLLSRCSITCLIICSILGVTIYTGVGLISLITDHNFLNYYSLIAGNTSSQHFGIFMVELGVGLTVAAVMCLIYLSLSVARP